MHCYFFCTHLSWSCFLSHLLFVAIGSFSSSFKIAHSFYCLPIIMAGMKILSITDTILINAPVSSLMYQTSFRNSRDYTPILFMINSLFISQLLRVLHITYIQCTTDVVLLDWEKRPSKTGRGGGVSVYLLSLFLGCILLLSSQILRMLYIYIFVTNGNHPSTTSLNPRKVSVWRKILIANEWNELQAVRRISIGFTSIWMAFILVGQGLQYSATSQPNLQDRSPGDMNPVLR